MRIIVCIIGLVVLAGGCENECPRMAGYYYAPGKTVEEARQDYRQCEYEVMKAAVARDADIPWWTMTEQVDATIRAGMRARGYEWYRRRNVPPGLQLAPVDMQRCQGVAID